MNKCLTIIILYCASFCCLKAQRPVTTCDDTLLAQLYRQMGEGNLYALRDMGSLLDRPQWALCVRQYIAERTFFQRHELDVLHTTRAQFMAFFYDNLSNIKFSPLLKAFYLTPLEEHLKPAHITRLPAASLQDQLQALRHEICHFDTLFRHNPVEATLPLSLGKIQQLMRPEGFQWLRETLASVRLKEDSTLLWGAMLWALSRETTTENLQLLFELCDQYPSLETDSLVIGAAQYLANQHRTIPQIRQLLDSMALLEDIRLLGYQTDFDVRPSFFYDDVDYFGHILMRHTSQKTSFLWRNALEDMLHTHHPRALFYTAALARWQSSFSPVLSDRLTQSTFFRLIAPPTEGVPPVLSRIEQAKSLVVWWATHYNDFEWDEAQAAFLDKSIIAHQTEDYDRLFRRLKDNDGAVAWQALNQLCKGQPLIVSELEEKFRVFLRDVNPELPDLSHAFMSQMAELNRFVTAQQGSITLRAALQPTLDVLLTDISEAQRFDLEAYMLSHLTLEDVSAFEFQSALNSRHKPFSFSAGHILDVYYSTHWTDIVATDEWLRLYLKKCYLFKRLANSGVSNLYTKKFDNMGAALQARLQSLLRVETDKDIREQINLLLNASFRPVLDQSTLDVFLEKPYLFEGQSLDYMAPPEWPDYEKITTAIINAGDRLSIRMILEYWAHYPRLEAVPHLFALIDDDMRISDDEADRREVVSDKIVAILQKVYHYSFKIDDEKEAWRLMWRDNADTYLSWGETFFKEQIGYLAQADSLTLSDVLQVATSEYYNETNKMLIINGLKKVRDLATVYVPKPIFSAKEDLMAFAGRQWTAAELGKLLDLCRIDDTAVILEFVAAQTQAYQEEDRLLFFEALWEKKWFQEYHERQQLPVFFVNLLLETYQNYWNTSPYVTPYIEQQIAIHTHALRYVGAPLRVRIEAFLTLDLDPETKQHVQRALLSRVRFEELPIVFEYWAQLVGTESEKLAFLTEDFGLPIFSLDTEGVGAFMVNYHKMSRLELYNHYLSQFGVTVLRSDSTLDYERIYDILKYDIAMPFIGGGPSRDYIVFATIKLLEYYFDERLGFAEKLNDNPTFISENALKRAAHWRDYLEHKGLIQPNPHVPDSFNQLYVGF